MEDDAGKRALLGAFVGLALVLAVLTGCGTPQAAGQPPTSTGVQTAVFGSIVELTLGVVVGPDLRVVDVNPGSAAEQAGIRRGGVLTKIGNEVLPAPGAAPTGTAQRRASPTVRPSPTGAHATAQGAFDRQAKHGQPIAVALKRNGQPLDLQIVPGGIGRGLGAPTPTPIPYESNLVFF